MKFFLACIILLNVNACIAQDIPSQPLNDVRSFEVSACRPGKNMLLAVWMEKRASRKDNDQDAKDMQLGYKYSDNDGKGWTEKEVIDQPNTFASGNPYVTCNEKGEAFLVCMHIGKSFYAGNISLYEFDFKKKKFNLKSIPVASDDKLLDKPCIVSFGNEIHLVYVVYGRNIRNSVKYQRSMDKGKTWTEAVSVFSDTGSDYLGPSITLIDGKQIAVSVGGYSKKSIMMAKLKQTSDSIAFEKSVVIANISAKISAAMSEISSQGNKVTITWQNPHQPNETWLANSNDGGNAWSTPVMVTSRGNLLSVTRDTRENIHCIYADFNDQQFFVGYKLLNSEFKIIKEARFTQPASLTETQEYIGAFQKLIIDKDDCFAFYVDYANGSTLRFSKWRM